MVLKADFLSVVLGRLATALLAVATLRIMTALLGPDDYGQWALFIAFQTFGSLFLINPVDQYLFRHVHEWWDRGILLGYLTKFRQYIRAISILIAVAVGVWFFFQDQSNSSLGHAVLASAAVGSILYFGAWNATLVTQLNVLGFRVHSVVVLITSMLIGLIFSIILVMQYQYAVSWIFGQAFGAAIGALCGWKILTGHAIQLKKEHRLLIASDGFLNRRNILLFCFPLAAATGFMWLQNTGYRFWVNGVWGPAELGILVVGLGISAQLTSIVEGLAMQFLYPYFARRIADAKSDAQTGEALSDLMNVLAPIYAVWAGFNAVCAAAFLELLTDVRYHAAVPFVVFGAVIEFFRCSTNLWSNTARAVRQTKGLIIPYVVGAVVVWGGAFGVAHLELGLIALSSVLVIAGIITCVFMIVLMQGMLHISLDVSRAAIGFGAMLACFVFMFISPIKIDGKIQGLILLLVAGSVTCLMMLGLLWRNPALKRLLVASLRAS